MNLLPRAVDEGRKNLSNFHSPPILRPGSLQSRRKSRAGFPQTCPATKTQNFPHHFYLNLLLAFETSSELFTLKFCFCFDGSATSRLPCCIPVENCVDSAVRFSTIPSGYDFQVFSRIDVNTLTGGRLSTFEFLLNAINTSTSD